MPGSCAGLVHVAARPHGVDRWHDIAEIDLKVGLLQRQRAAAEARELLDADHGDGLRAAGLDRPAGFAQRRGAAGTGVLHIGDRNAGHAEIAQDALADQWPAIARAAERLVDIAALDAGILHGAGQRLAAKILDAALRLLAEFRHADAGNRCQTHGTPLNL
jgi:hypothetical protein